MDITSLATRYETLCKELRQRMSASSKWTGLPALLDEIHAVRCLYRSQVAGFLLTPDSDPAVLRHQMERPQFRYHGSLVL
jgi:hypothetical protein